MKVHVYQVRENDEANLTQLLQELAGIDRDDRFVDEVPSGICLEELVIENGIYFADFMKRRVHGPGRYRVGEPIDGFDIDIAAGERFAEETSMVYVPQLGFAAVQYNHFGPRVGTIERYLNQVLFDLLIEREGGGGSFDFAVRLKQDTYERLRRMNLFRSVEVKISIPSVTEEDRRRGRTLSNALENVMGGVETFTYGINVSPARGSSLRREEFFGLIDEAQRFGFAVKELKAKAKETEDTSAEEFDLINERLELSFQIDPGEDGRLPREARWTALRGAIRTWRENGAI